MFSRWHRSSGGVAPHRRLALALTVPDRAFDNEGVAEGLKEREESCEPSRAIADARRERRPVTLFDAHVRAFREHGIEMG